MVVDVKLNQGDGTFSELNAHIVKTISFDFMLDLQDRRHGGGLF